MSTSAVVINLRKRRYSDTVSTQTVADPDWKCHASGSRVLLRDASQLGLHRVLLAVDRVT